MNSPKMSLNFGKSKEMGAQMAPPAKPGAPQEMDDSSEEMSEQSDLMQIKDLLMQGDTKGALKLVESCLSGHEDESEVPNKEDKLDQMLQGILNKKG